jgi:misacylated tRNA(Ala) deacylase
MLNEPKKSYHEPMHTCEHILNQTMVRMFDCGRSVSAHIERKKSKCDYLLQVPPSDTQIQQIVEQVNGIIREKLAVTSELMNRVDAGKIVDLSKLPDEASELLRIVKVGNYDACACIGQHVTNTSEIGQFEIISHDFQDGRWRVRFRLV